MEKIKVGISACLLGKKVRYDGGHKLDRYLTDTLGRYVEWVPVCPEVEYGLPVPREAMHLVGTRDECRLVTIRTGIDHTEGMRAWAESRLLDLAKTDLSGFVFKSKSPSSGLRSVKVYNKEGMPSQTGIGIFAKAFTERFPLTPVEDDGRLHDPGLRENFIERLFAFQRWKDFLKSDGSLGGLVRFHRDHKFLILSHSPEHYTQLGRLVAQGQGHSGDRLHDLYLPLLMTGLKRMATARKHANVLQHLAGYFKRNLSPDEKQELIDIIEQYRLGLIPLIVPVVLVKHFVRKYDEPYLKSQYYLNPHPLELMLRNHV